MAHRFLVKKMRRPVTRPYIPPVKPSKAKGLRPAGRYAIDPLTSKETGAGREGPAATMVVWMPGDVPPPKCEV